MPEIADVLMSVESREFWERAFLIGLAAPLKTIGDCSACADIALAAWRERFVKAPDA